MTNLEELLADCTKTQLKELRDVTGRWRMPGGYGLYGALRDYKGKTRSPNVVVLKAECGQEMTVKLDGIDEGQIISGVTIRGVTYVPK